MHRRGLGSAAFGAIALVVGASAGLLEQPGLAFVAAAAGGVAGLLGYDLARSRTVPQPIAARTAGVDNSAGDELRLIDPVTGLFTREYFVVTLDARVATARRVLRPLSIIILEVVEGAGAGDRRPADLGPVAEAILATLREADTACLLDDRRIGVLLEDTPEDGAVWTAERLRRSLGTAEGGRTLWAGIASYPSHGLTAEELQANAASALALASDWPQDRIEVAASTV